MLYSPYLDIGCLGLWLYWNLQCPLGQLKRKGGIEKEYNIVFPQYINDSIVLDCTTYHLTRSSSVSRYCNTSFTAINTPRSFCKCLVNNKAALHREMSGIWNHTKCHNYILSFKHTVNIFYFQLLIWTFSFFHLKCVFPIIGVFINLWLYR